MERPTRVQQLYGYSVCLVAIITALITFPGIIDSIALRRAPLMAARFGGGESSIIGPTFEAHKLANPGYRYVSRTGGYGDNAVYDTLSEDDARRRYEARREERIATVRYETSRDLVRNVALLLISLGLFVGHWRWLRGISETDATRKEAP